MDAIPVELRDEFRARMLNATLQFARELEAAGTSADLFVYAAIDDTADGVAIHFWATSMTGVSDSAAKDAQAQQQISTADMPTAATESTPDASDEQPEG